MRVTPVHYAKALYESVKEKSSWEINESISRFVELLGKNNQLKLAPKIIDRFSEIYNQDHGIVEAEVVSREKLSNELRNKISNYVSKRYNAKKVILKNIIDEKIKGGMVIKVGDEVIDGSIENKLMNLKKLLQN